MRARATMPTNGRSAPGADQSWAAAARPRKGLAVVTCMDARIDLRELGIETGDAHVLRNAGGIVTDDTIRSLMLSQRLLGTTEIMLIHHTGCGLHNLDEVGFKARVGAETGA